MSIMSAAEVEACRAQLLRMKAEAQGTQGSYKTAANHRIAMQQKIAQMVQLVQGRSSDVELVEDVIIASLKAETQASLSQCEIPEAPVIDPNNQPSGRTASAEEAMASYKSQMAILQKEHEYREGMRKAEELMGGFYKNGIDRILAVMKEHCKDPRLMQQLQGIANS
jgi:hypothetical protein